MAVRSSGNEFHLLCHFCRSLRSPIVVRIWMLCTCHCTYNFIKQMWFNFYAPQTVKWCTQQSLTFGGSGNIFDSSCQHSGNLMGLFICLTLQYHSGEAVCIAAWYFNFFKTFPTIYHNLLGILHSWGLLSHAFWPLLLRHFLVTLISATLPIWSMWYLSWALRSIFSLEYFDMYICDLLAAIYLWTTSVLYPKNNSNSIPHKIFLLC